MSEEFGTVNLKREDSREIDMLRRHYRAHRDTLGRLVGDSPSAVLAAEYQRLIGEIDNALLKLDELEGKKPPVNTDTNPAMRTTGPGTRPLVRTGEGGPMATEPLESAPSARSRIAIIVVAAVIVLAIIGWLIWRASSERAQSAPIVEQPITNTTTNAAPPPAVTPAPAPAAPLAFAVTPAAADYGVIRRGTRAVRQFQIANNGATPVDIAVARSACRCLYYDYNSKLPANGKENITVTVDGARAKPGPLLEQVEIHSKKDPTIKATFEVRATIR